MVAVHTYENVTVDGYLAGHAEGAIFSEKKANKDSRPCLTVNTALHPYSHPVTIAGFCEQRSAPSE